MTRRADLHLIVRVARAMTTAGVLRPMPPSRLVRAARAGRTLQATHAASIAISAALNPDGIGVYDDDGSITWTDLDRHSRAIASALVAQYDIGPARPLAILCRNHRGLIEALAAAAHTGADALLLNTEMPAEQIATVLSTYPVGAVATDEEFLPRLPAGTPVAPPLDELAVLPMGERPAAPPTRRNRIVILTSGTTGVPKAAARDLPARAMAGPLLAMIEDFGLRRGEPVLIGPPLFHGFGLGIASVATAIGAPLVLHRRFEAEAAIAAIREHRVGCVVGVPVMLQRLLTLGPAGPMPRLRGVVSAGAPLSPTLATQLLDEFGDVVINAYGSTETGFGSYATAADLRAAPGTVGRPPFGSTAHVLADDHRPVAAGRTGHIFIGGDLVFDGYVHGGSKERVGALMNTGDLGHLDAAGRLFVDGREDDMIVSGGENVFPQEVEDALGAHPKITEAVVVGVPDAEFGQRLVAHVVLASPATSDELSLYLRTRLERYKLPREFVFTEEIPRNATGKVLRARLTSHEGAS